jgi:ribose transport system permease protein
MTNVRNLDLGLTKFSGLYMWALFIIVFSILAPATFPTTATVHLLASTQAIAAMVALGLLVPMVTGNFDVSIGATANLAGMVSVMLQLNGLMSVGPAILLGVLTGVMVGAFNGFVVVKLRVDPFIGTLGTSSILGAVQVVVTGNQEPLPVQSSFFNSMTQGSLLGFQYVFFYMLLLALVLWWILEKTPVGRRMYATGGNREAARLTGINVNRVSFLALTASGGICGLAGVLFVSLTGPSLGFGGSLLLPAFAAVFLGSTQLRPGKPNVWGTLLAIFVLATGVQGLQLVSGVQWVAALFNGVALIAAVSLAVNRERQRRGSKARPDDAPVQPTSTGTGTADDSSPEQEAKAIPVVVAGGGAAGTGVQQQRG